jgi:hypothetical protein
MSFFNYHTFEENQIQIKTPYKKIINAETFYFASLKHKQNPIYIKTPKLDIPFGLNTFTDQNQRNSYSFVMSFTDSDIDTKIRHFAEFIQKCEQWCQETVKTHLSIWNVLPSYESLLFKSSLKNCNGTLLFRLKITPNITEIYDEQNKPHEFTEIPELIHEHCQIISLIELNNIWINTSQFGLTWKVHQIKVFPRNKPIGGISLINDDITSYYNIQTVDTPPDPPPPPPTQKVYRPPMTNPLIACFAMITTGQFQLRKTEQETEHRSYAPNNQPQISLADILNIRNNLRSTKKITNGDENHDKDWSD